MRPPDVPARDPRLEELLERHLPALRAYIRLRSGQSVRRKESSSDLVQSVCLEVLREKGQFEYRSESAFRRWLFRAAERKIIDRVRFWQSERRDGDLEVRLPADDSQAEASLLGAYASLVTPSRQLMAREQLLRLETAFDSLPKDYRDMITACRFLSMSHEEIARQTGRSEGAVRTLLCRALARLSQALAAADGEASSQRPAD